MLLWVYIIEEFLIDRLKNNIVTIFQYTKGNEGCSTKTGGVRYIESAYV